MSILKLALFASLPFVALGARQRRATTDEFELFAYGPKLGGPGLFYADGYAYIGDPSLSNSSDAATVICRSSLNGAFTGSPNTTNLANSTSADWSNVTLFVPGPSNTDHRVGFLDSSNTTTSSDIITDSFFFYGSTAMVKGSDGSLETFWTGLAVGNTGVYALYWNDTSLGQVHLTMRNVGPSSPPAAVPISTVTPASRS
ncbi:hypothetical protein K505DRAFT_294905 [Melanomma pulvis-pyrius CBS 109.77]|uniref:Lytic polysaccharide monooxygenase n=1 Tax=Melanomma pulvis-pyrius CBS 109.77 TaxID=1314802 RepID=A0A6A6XS81_9PLEO|nr:hypothetical protein K505DRAFT_294905 [Melanomma pulvis-pyrius CBS 109.77]